MAQGLGINEIIDINTTISSGGIGPADFGTGLLLVNDTTLAAAGSGKIRRFSGYDEVDSIFDNEIIKREASIWFASDPAPKALYIARIVEQDLATVGVSATLSADQRNAFSGNAFNGRMVVNGHTVSGSNPASGSLTDIASNLETRFAASHTSISGTTVEPDNGKLVFTLKTSAGAINPAPMVVTNVSGGTGTDMGPIFGFCDANGNSTAQEGDSDTDGAYYRQGHVAQGVSEALSEVVGYASGGRPTNLMVSDTVGNSIAAGSPSGKINALRSFAQSGDYVTAFVESNVIDSNNAITPTSQIAVANNSSQGKVMAIYSDASETGTNNRRIDIAVLAKLSAQDFDQPQSIITLVPKSLSGVVPTNVTSAQINGIEAVNASVYTTVGGYPALLGGKASNGTWIDAQYWLAWLKDEMERNIYNAMRQSKRFDNVELTDTIHKVMAKAINTGGIKLGGIVNTAMKKEIRILTQNPGFDGTLQNGYLLYIQPYSSLTDIDRANRHQSFKVWISPSDAIHSVGGTIVLSG